MMRTSGALLAAVATVALIAGGCDSVAGGGPKKIVFNETVCANQSFVRMTGGDTYRMVLDNDVTSEGQSGMTVRLQDVPLVVKGDIPPNSVLGDPFSTLVLSAPAGEERSMDVVATRTGAYKLICGVIIGARATASEMTLQIINP